MKKTIAILLGVLVFMCFVIYIPVMEENHHIENDPHYLDGKYELKNNFEPIKVDTVNKK